MSFPRGISTQEPIARSVQAVRNKRDLFAMLVLPAGNWWRYCPRLESNKGPQNYEKAIKLNGISILSIFFGS
jgi:hypothetical protein